MAFPKKEKKIEKPTKISRAFVKNHPGSKKNPQGPDFYSIKFGRKGKQGDVAVKQVGDKWRTNLNVPMLKPFLPKFFDKRDKALEWLEKVYTMSVDKKIGMNFQLEQIKELGLEWSFKVPKSARKVKKGQSLDLVKITETFELDRKGGFPMASKKKSTKKNSKKSKKTSKKKDKKKKKKKSSKKNIDKKALKKIKVEIKKEKDAIKEERVASKAVIKEHRDNIKVLKKKLRLTKKGK